MKTAVDKLIETLEDDGYRFDKDVVDNAREEFKQQIIDFTKKCQLVRDIDCDGNVTFCFDPKVHYDKTFNK